MTVTAKDIPFSSSQKIPSITERTFRDVGEQQYVLELKPAGITFAVTRLRRAHQETVGELTVTVNGNFPDAKSVGGILSRGNFNFSSIQTRSTLSKLLAERSSVKDLDWHGFLDEFAFKVLDAERKGAPAVVLADEPDSDESADTWDINGLPILQDLPMVLFGAGGSGKSYYAMYLAGSLGNLGVPVLYADWEFSRRDHRRRFGRLFQPMPKNVHYITCDKPIQEEAERILGMIRQLRIQYLVADSMVFAVAGRAEDSEAAGIYFRTIRQFKVGSLNIAHTTKADDESEKKIFGSVFFTNGARSVWFIQKADENPRGELQFGLFHRKSNVGELLKPKGYKLVFQSGRTLIERVKVDDVDELAAKLPLLDRMKRVLKRGAISVKGLADATDATPSVIRKMVSRYGSVFVRTGDKIGLLTAEGQSVDF